jgi:uncharacterized membrane protein
MNWLTFAFLTIISYAVFDFFMKLSSQKIDAGLGGFIINAVSAVVLAIFIALVKIRGDSIPGPKPGGILYSLLAGTAIGLATIFFLKMFSSGVNLSVGVPLVRVGIVLLASILGIVILKEGFTAKYIIGMLLALAGLYLIILK